MKSTVSALAMMAAVASAAVPMRHLHFPRNNDTAAVVNNRVSPSVPLTTGTPTSPDASNGAAGKKPQYKAPGADEEDTSFTTTRTSVIHKTVTSYVHGAATSAAAVKPALQNAEQDTKGDSKDAGDSKSTTTVTSKTTTTVIVSKHGHGHGAGAGAGAGNDQCTPATVTVTAPAVTKTVYATPTPDGVNAGERGPATSQLLAGDASTAPRPTSTLQSVVTVVPYPSNGTYAGGSARPSSGFARLRR